LSSSWLTATAAQSVFAHSQPLLSPVMGKTFSINQHVNSQAVLFIANIQIRKLTAFQALVTFSG